VQHKNRHFNALELARYINGERINAGNYPCNKHRWIQKKCQSFSSNESPPTNYCGRERAVATIQNKGVSVFEVMGNGKHRRSGTHA